VLSIYTSEVDPFSLKASVQKGSISGVSIQ
jgi:hypothetical protein